MRLAAAEYDRCAEMLRSLTPAQWAMPTDCPAWDVRQMAAHMLGMAEMAASIRENLRQQRKATKVAGSGGVYIDALTQLVEHLPEDLRVPVVDAAEDREHETTEQHVVEVRDDEVGVGLLRVGDDDRLPERDAQGPSRKPHLHGDGSRQPLASSEFRASSG
jgi:uncharacterized protein (TIGR03083 family)